VIRYQPHRAGVRLANTGGDEVTLPHQNLAAWQRADDLFLDIHRLTHHQVTRFERFELGSQLRRAAWSIPANIVEGLARGPGLDAIRFLKIARASLSELGYGLHACRRLGDITNADFAEFELKLRAVGGPLQGLIVRRRTNVGLRTLGSLLIAILVFAQAMV
jgi:four helix bundle protein